MPVDLYSMAPSAPCRSVLMTAKALGVDVNVKPVNLFAGEHMTPEFLKLNPQHNVPTIDDDGFVLNESRAICTYLVRKYGKDDSLYPKDVQKRALVDQRLYFDMGSFYDKFAKVYVSIWPFRPSLQHIHPLDICLGRFEFDNNNFLCSI